MPENKNLRSVTFDRDYAEPTVDIEGGAFSGCSNLRKVILPNLIANKTYIPVVKRDGIFLPGSLFRNCQNLENVILPDNIESMGVSIFRGCASLESLHIPEGVIEMNEYVIMGCSSLEYISLPSSLIDLSPIEASNNCTFVCPTGSVAEQYIKDDEKECHELGLDYISYNYINTVPTDILGDVNGDNSLDINDVTLIQKRLADLYPFDLCNYDANQDSRMSISDATEIQWKIANLN